MKVPPADGDNQTLTPCRWRDKTYATCPKDRVSLGRSSKLLAFVSDNLFEPESFDDCWRKGPFSSKHVVDEGTVDPRLPRPGRLTARPIYGLV